MTSRAFVSAVALALVAVLAACGGGAEAPTVSPSATDGLARPPAVVAQAFCDLVDARGRIASDEVGEAYHRAQLATFGGAVEVTRDVVLPALVVMSNALEAIDTWQPARAFAGHGMPLVSSFTSAAHAFVEGPTEQTFARVDGAAQALRDELFAGEFARAGPVLFQAACG